VPLMIGHRIMGTALQFLGDIDASLAHHHQALTVYDRSEHRTLATRFNVDTKVAVLSYRSQALWLLGYSDAARADARRALNDARELGHAATLMFALSITSYLIRSAEITQKPPRKRTKSVRWRTRRALSFGRRAKWSERARYWP